MHAIVLAGGKGSRLLPHTAHRPKPLLQFGRCSLLEIIIRRLRSSGFSRVTLCVSHLGEMIERTFGDGRELDIQIDYAVDDAPLGTAAPLLAVRDWHTPALVINGDVLTAIDFAELCRVHRLQANDMTVVIHRLQMSISYGVIGVGGAGEIVAIQEKPLLPVDVAAGIYVVNPAVSHHIQANEPLDMPELIGRLIVAHQAVRAYRFDGPWHDIGNHDSYQAAQQDFAANPELYLHVDAGLPTLA